MVTPVEIAAGSWQDRERARRPAGGGCAMQVIARDQREHCKVHEMPYGKIYSWRPERIVFRCDCGGTLVWRRPATACACGALHADVPRDAEGGTTDGEHYHPWLEAYEEWRGEKDANNLPHEYFGFVGAASGD